MGYNFYNTRQLMIKISSNNLRTWAASQIWLHHKFLEHLHVVYLNLYFHICSQKCLLSHLSMMFVKFLSTIMLPFFLVIVKLFLLLILFILMYEDLLLNQFLRLCSSNFY
ncbi:hypothetical protein CR513_31931, partial [Mucuna pruriens]